MYNRKDMAELEAKLKEAIDTDGTEKRPDAQKLFSDITGPGTGLIYEYDEQKLHLADGWIFDNDGNIVKLDDVTGPGTGMVYKDGQLVPAE